MESTDQYLELAQLAGEFIHELKNPLSALGMNLQLLAEDFEAAESAREKRALLKIQKLQGECQRLVDLSNDFLRFARISRLEREPCDLSDVVEELIDFYGPTAQRGGIDIRVHLSADLPPVCLNRELFKQALLNLFLNAQQAMPEGGVLTIQANLEPCRAADTDQEAGSSTNGTAEWVCLYIIDTGVGMAPDVAARVFRPFFSTRPGGSGLGLPTTRKIIEAHGGTIDVQSAVGRGTRFTLRLPADEGVQAEVGSDAPAACQESTLPT